MRGGDPCEGSYSFHSDYFPASVDDGRQGSGRSRDDGRRGNGYRDDDVLLATPACVDGSECSCHVFNGYTSLAAVNHHLPAAESLSQLDDRRLSLCDDPADETTRCKLLESG